MSRFDAFGMFWEDMKVEKKRGGRGPRPMPAIPDTGWTPPTSFPRLESAPALAIDTETYDPDLLTHGPGWATGDGHIVGLSVATGDGHSWYFPMRHEVGGGNLDAGAVLRWAAVELSRDDQPKVGANLQYDIGWLRREGVDVRGELIDVQFAAPLLDEHRYSYSLDALAEEYLGEGKVDDALYDWCLRAYGGKPGRKQAGNIYRAPACLVGPYAEADAELPLRIWEHQRMALEDQGLLDLFRMECKLIRLLIEMRMRGVRVDVDAAQRACESLAAREGEVDKRLGGLDPNSRDDLRRAFDSAGIAYPRTAAGNPSFREDFLRACDHPLAKDIIRKRNLAKIRGTFIEGYILDKARSGRIHAEFHPLRSDDSGTVSGRFSSSSPNLQNLPSRDPAMRRLVRGLFLPEDGEQWVAADYSQIEYRLLVHAATGPGAEEARQQYRDDPDTDYHAMTQDYLRSELKRDVPRKPVKNINFGMIFGMGKGKLKAQLTGLTDAEAEAFFAAYDASVPYARATAIRAEAVASRRGYIRTVLGRRARFPFWESAQYYSATERAKLLRDDPTFFDLQRSRDAAVRKWGPRVRRAMIRKALNTYTQGSCADILKAAMVGMWEQGLAIPLLTVHDELDWSMPRDAAGTGMIAACTDIMASVVELSIPIRVDVEVGDDWGSLTPIGGGHG